MVGSSNEYEYKIKPSSPSPAPQAHPPGKDKISQVAHKIWLMVQHFFQSTAETLQKLFTNARSMEEAAQVTKQSEEKFFLKEAPEMVENNYNSLRDKVARDKSLEKTSGQKRRIYDELCEQLNADLKRLGGLDIQVNGESKHFKYAQDLFTFFRIDLGLPAEKVYRILAQLQQSVFAEFQAACIEKTGLIPIDRTLTEEGTETGGWKIGCIVKNREIRIDHNKEFSLQNGAEGAGTVSAHVWFIFPRNEEPAKAFFSWKISEV